MFSRLSIVLLLIALPVLAALQYQWIGQISQSERQRLEEGVRDSSARFAEDFAQGIRRVVTTFELRDGLPEDAGPIVTRYEQWNEAATGASYPHLLRTIYLIKPDAMGSLELFRVDIQTQAFQSVDWPASLLELKESLMKELPPAPSDRRREDVSRGGRGGNPGFANDPFRRGSRGGRAGGRGPFEFPAPRGPQREGWLLAELDEDVLVKEVLPDLVTRRFPVIGDQDFRVTVVSMSGSPHAIFTSGEPWSSLDMATPDHVADLLEYSGPLGPRGNAAHNRPPLDNMLAVLIPINRPSSTNVSLQPRPDIAAQPRPDVPAQPRLDPPGRPNTLRTPQRGGAPRTGRRNFGQGPPVDVAFVGQNWRLMVKHQSGSLEAAVTQLRRRDLAISFGILVVLGIGAVTAVLSGQRARTLGKLQMEFAAGVSHELRTPLAVIQSAAHNLRAGVIKDKEGIAEYAGIVQTEARRLSDMVEHVMTYAETQSGRKRYDIGPIDLMEVIDRATQHTEMALGQSNVTMDQVIDSSLPPALADSSALTQCLQNLLSNAAKYGKREDGAVQIEIEAKFDREARKVNLSVTDHGPGVPADDVRHLFEPFHRGSNAATSTPGNGLGLHLVRKIMEAQNGAVTYEEGKDGGARFTLTMPAADGYFI
jgi:signal transduction histidine kinase